MKRKESVTSWEQDTYQTGATTPPRHSRGPMAVLLVLVVLLAGLLSMSGLLNLRLFATLYTQDPTHAPVSLENCSQTTAESQCAWELDGGTPSIGITGDSVKAVHQRHFQLPEGLFITEVAAGSDAYLQGVREGDVLLSLDGCPITDQVSLDGLLQNINIGDPVDVVIYRHGNDGEITVSLTVTEYSDEVE